ncbi:MAG: DUF4230 domain-containing protein [Methylacidiphilales bacterium]|nr:DUF4230 domain-containing protein [Candidatus Methylacidiphilales bacterium]
MKHYLGICLVLVTLAVIGFFALHRCTLAVDHTVMEVRDAFAEVLKVQPQIKIDQRVILAQTAPIAELAVVTKEEQVTLGFSEHLEVLSMQVPLTEKKLTAEATFRLKAGFDLSEPFSVSIDPATHDIRATMPHAKILSVEQEGELVYHGDDAMLNRVTDQDRAEILNDLQNAARDTAEKSSLKSEAEQQVTERLKELINHNGQSIQLEWHDLAAKMEYPPRK